MKKATSLIVVSMMLFSLIMIAPLSVSSELAVVDHTSPMKFDGTSTYSDEVNSLKVLGKPVKPPVPVADKWALIIGIADYEGKGSDLWHPDEDAKEMYSELTSQQGYASANVKMITNRGATASAILSGIDWLISNEKATSEVVFFYSGHGFRAPDSEDWDIDVESDGYDEGIVSHDLYGLPDGLLKQKFAAIESTKFALMFGSCHSGGMFDDNDDLQQTGRVIASACMADQYGWDYLSLGNTLWGYYFVDDALLDNKAGSIEAAHAYAYSRVVAVQPDSQPQLFDGIAGDFAI